MKRIECFHKLLANALGAEKHECKFTYMIDNGMLMLHFSAKNPGKKNCVNEKHVLIRPDQSAKHHMEVVEIWYGYDASGSVWSDNLGGRSIDCTGKDNNSALSHVAETIKNDYKNLFEKGV